MSEIASGSMVSLSYCVKIDEGKIVDESAAGKPLVFTVGESDVIPGLTVQIIGMKKGEKKSFQVEPREAYGEHDPEYVRSLPLKLFPQEIQIKPGDMLTASTKDGQQIPFAVVEIREDSIVADFNHVLAGKTLFFDVEIIDIRDGMPTAGDE
jgi:FKBP-type peptidyl-prolyl cis-trans isomerase SlyD